MKHLTATPEKVPKTKTPKSPELTYSRCFMQILCPDKATKPGGWAEAHGQGQEDLPGGPSRDTEIPEWPHVGVCVKLHNLQSTVQPAGTLKSTWKLPEQAKRWDIHRRDVKIVA